METVRYADFSQGIHRRAAGERIPLSGSIEVTRRCPFHCLHCYNNLPVADRESRKNELTYEEHCRILDEIADAGCLWLLYTGGEIFARNDFPEIYTYAKRKGLLITLFTNGSLVSPKVADYLAQWRPFSIEITLYGRTRETYERISGIPGSYDRCIQGIYLLKSRGLPVKLKTMVITANRHEVWQMKRFAEEDLGLEFRFDGMINPRIDCSPGPLNLRLTPEEIVSLDLQDPKRMTEWKRFAEKFIRPTRSRYGEEIYQCGGGWNTFAIDPYGRLSPCELSCADAFDLRQGSFQEGWDTFLRQVRGKKISRLTKCTACPLTDLCGMCPANGHLENQDPETPIDFLCQVAHLRAHILDISIQPHGECEYCEGGINHQDLLKSAVTLRYGKNRERGMNLWPSRRGSR